MRVLGFKVITWTEQGKDSLAGALSAAKYAASRDRVAFRMLFRERIVPDGVEYVFRSKAVSLLYTNVAMREELEKMTAEFSRVMAANGSREGEDYSVEVMTVE